MKLKLTNWETNISKTYEIKELGDINGRVIQFCHDQCIKECYIELNGKAEINVVLQGSRSLGALFG